MNQVDLAKVFKGRCKLCWQFGSYESGCIIMRKYLRPPISPIERISVDRQTEWVRARRSDGVLF